MKLVLAAPESFLPSEPTAFASQVSAMHFFMNEVFAAPASGLPSLPTALVSQVSCANAAPPANVRTNTANINFLSMGFPLFVQGAAFSRSRFSVTAWLVIHPPHAKAADFSAALLQGKVTSAGQPQLRRRPVRRRSPHWVHHCSIRRRNTQDARCNAPADRNCSCRRIAEPPL